MNSNKVIVSGKNATTSVFINCSQSQKEEAERLEYEIKNSCTSTEEEAENDSDDESDDDCSDYDSDEGEPEEKSSYIVGQKQKPRVERKSWYRVKKEEEAEKYVDDEDCEEDDDDKTMHDSEEEEEELRNNYEKSLKDEIERLNKVARKLMENQAKLTERFNRKNKEVKELKKQLKEAEPTPHWNTASYWKENYNNYEKKYEWLQNLYCEEKEKRIDLEKQLEELKNDTCDYEYMHVLDKKNKELEKELREERIFRRDNEDNFFRLLDEHRRLEKVMKKVTI
jgi:hypothetical protein